MTVISTEKIKNRLNCSKKLARDTKNFWKSFCPTDQIWQSRLQNNFLLCGKEWKGCTLSSTRSVNFMKYRIRMIRPKGEIPIKYIFCTLTSTLSEFETLIHTTLIFQNLHVLRRFAKNLSASEFLWTRSMTIFVILWTFVKSYLEKEYKFHLKSFCTMM